MKTKLLILLSGLFLLMGTPLQAAEKLKLAYVNINKAINLSKEGQRSKKFLEAQAEQTKMELQKKEQELRQKDAELKNAIMLTPEAKEAKQQELIRLQQELRKAVATAEKNFRKDESRHTGKIFKDIRTVVEKIAKKENYDFVLENSLRQTLLFSKYEIVDITEQVINEYNKLQSLK